MISRKLTDKIALITGSSRGIKACGGDAIALQADVSKIEDIRRLFDQTIDHFGRLDILINNAGIRISKDAADIDEAEYDRLFAINVKGTFFACQLAARRLSDGGRIINISSAVTRVVCISARKSNASSAAGAGSRTSGLGGGAKSG